MTRALLNSVGAVVVRPKNGIIPRKRWSEIVELMWGEREREREDAFGMGKKRTTARNGARHAIGARENLVLHTATLRLSTRLHASPTLSTLDA